MGLTCFIFRFLRRPQTKLSRRKEKQHANKIVGELNFGFWVSMFNKDNETVLWNTLEKAFPKLPKSNRQRTFISPKLNKIRVLRNRAFHHEPILWMHNDLDELYKIGIELIEYIDSDLYVQWLHWHDIFKKKYSKYKSGLSNFPS